MGETNRKKQQYNLHRILFIIAHLLLFGEPKLQHFSFKYDLSSFIHIVRAIHVNGTNNDKRITDIVYFLTLLSSVTTHYVAVILILLLSFFFLLFNVFFRLNRYVYGLYIKNMCKTTIKCKILVRKNTGNRQEK